MPQQGIHPKIAWRPNLFLNAPSFASAHVVRVVNSQCCEIPFTTLSVSCTHSRRLSGPVSLDDLVTGITLDAG
jgi:hypothetical protein